MTRRLLDTSSPLRLALLALALAGCFLVWRSPSLSPEEARLYTEIRAAQNLLWAEMERRGQTDPANDPDRSGFIGLDWSETSTTLGNLEAKRNACDPLWGVMALRWFDKLGLGTGDRIVALSSASFPGLLYSVLAAGESRGLKIDLVVSLGSSAWGANRPSAPWPVLARILAARGFLRTRPVFYTLGGDHETARGMPPEGARALTEAARSDGTELYVPSGLDAVIGRKMTLIAPGDGDAARLVVNIGGGHSSLGTDGAVVDLANGPLGPSDRRAAGNGVIARTLEKDIPVLHLLHLRSLADRAGIAFTERRPHFTGGSPWPAVAGLALFILALATHRRWSWDA